MNFLHLSLAVDSTTFLLYYLLDSYLLHFKFSVSCNAGALKKPLRLSTQSAPRPLGRVASLPLTSPQER